MNDDQYQEMFDNYWDEICEYAQSINVLPSYIEEEFLIDGELIKAKEPNKPNEPIPPRRPPQNKKFDYMNLEKQIEMYFGSSYEGDIDDL